MNSKKHLFESYYQTIKNMNLKSVYPFTETEIQPSYCQLWNLYIDKLIDNYNDEIQISEWCINYSVIRSMMIMDLIYHPNKNKVFEFYQKLLNNIYVGNDIFSINTNTPNIYLNVENISFTYTKQNRYINDIISTCYSLCYEIHQDIYADSGYEVCGPYIFNDFKIILMTFSFEKLGVIKILFKVDINENPKIDLFGHIFNYELNFSQCSILLNDELIHDNLKLFHMLNCLLIFEKSQIKDPIKTNLMNRFRRYEKLNQILNISIPQDEIFQNIQINKRICDKKKLLQMIKF